MPRVIDQLGREVVLKAPAQRIVSTVPSQTELLFDLGLAGQIVGRTRFCIHPKKELQSLPDIGGTKSLKLDLVRSLKPDLVIANKEENEKQDIEALAKEFPVYISDVDNVETALAMMADVGLLTGKQEAAKSMVQEVSKGFEKMPLFQGSVAYLIWYKPYMATGTGTYIDHLLQRLGLENVLESETRYPEVTIQQIQSLEPDYIFLSSEPFPFKQEHVAQLKEVLPKAKILLVDGEMFSWYGSRMLKAIPYFRALYKDLL